MIWFPTATPVALLLTALTLAHPIALLAQDVPGGATTPRPASPEADAAVHRALDYLKSAQKSDGSWESGGFGRATSVTSLAVMAFLSAGHVPGEPGPYRESVEKGILYVLDHQRSNGLLVSNTSHGPMYCHGISTLMLAEVVGMTAEAPLADRAREALGRAVKLILLAQNLAKNPENSGGWRYQPTSRDSDLSVSGWQVMALRAAKSAGCAVPSENIDRAIDYLKRCASQEGGFGYQPGGGPNNPRTGTGILALEICGEHQTREAVAGAEYLLKHPPAGPALTSSTKSITARKRCFRWATSTSSPITQSSSRSSWSTKTVTAVGSPPTATTAPGAGTTAPRWRFSLWRLSIGICRSTRDRLIFGLKLPNPARERHRSVVLIVPFS